MTPWICLNGKTEALNLSRVRSVKRSGKDVLYFFHTEFYLTETFPTEAEANIRFGQVLGLLGASM